MKQFYSITAEKALNLALQYGEVRDCSNGSSFKTDELLVSAKKIYDFLKGESYHFIDEFKD